MLICIDPAWDRLPRSGGEARRLGERYYFSGRVCPFGHTCPRLAKKLSCLICHREASRRFWRARCGSEGRLSAPKRQWRLEEFMPVEPVIRLVPVPRPARLPKHVRPDDLASDDALMILPASAAAASGMGIGRFYTGVPCPKGHVEARYVRQARCVECVRIKKRHCPSKMRRRERSKASGGNARIRWVRELLERQGGRCAACRNEFGVVGFHRDHIMPLARGGSTTRSNIQLLCPGCNLTKGAQHPDDFTRTYFRSCVSLADGY
jgi:5-methylcytosine-specific restriction endonuclease McrA